MQNTFHKDCTHIKTDFQTIGAMSATMWASGMLSDNDIQTLSEFIEETMK